MKEFVVLTAIGRDRVGIVDDLSTGILESSCNIEESRMALLGGEFVSILLVSGESSKVASLRESVQSLGDRLELQLELRPTRSPESDPDSRPYVLESVSLDTPGIVHAVTGVLRKHGVNIHDLETETTSAPWTGAPMFVMKARIAIPRGVSVPKLRGELDELSLAHDLDIKLTAQ